VPVAGEDPRSVAAALNDAANGIATDVADWIGAG
jgi:cholesterol transport system auxiliary component